MEGGGYRSSGTPPPPPQDMAAPPTMPLDRSEQHAQLYPLPPSTTQLHSAAAAAADANAQTPPNNAAAANGMLSQGNGGGRSGAFHSLHPHDSQHPQHAEQEHAQLHGRDARPRRVRCEDCGKNFAHRSGLSRHRKLHHRKARSHARIPTLPPPHAMLEAVSHSGAKDGAETRTASHVAVAAGAPGQPPSLDEHNDEHNGNGKDDAGSHHANQDPHHEQQPQERRRYIADDSDDDDDHDGDHDDDRDDDDDDDEEDGHEEDRRALRRQQSGLPKKRHHCRICDRAYKYRSGLSRHRRRVHQSEAQDAPPHGLERISDTSNDMSTARGGDARAARPSAPPPVISAAATHGERMDIHRRVPIVPEARRLPPHAHIIDRHLEISVLERVELAIRQAASGEQLLQELYATVTSMPPREAGLLAAGFAGVARGISRRQHAPGLWERVAKESETPGSFWARTFPYELFAHQAPLILPPGQHVAPSGSANHAHLAHQMAPSHLDQHNAPPPPQPTPLPPPAAPVNSDMPLAPHSGTSHNGMVSHRLHVPQHIFPPHMGGVSSLPAAPLPPPTAAMSRHRAHQVSDESGPPASIAITAASGHGHEDDTHATTLSHEPRYT